MGIHIKRRLLREVVPVVIMIDATLPLLFCLLRAVSLLPDQPCH